MDTVSRLDTFEPELDLPESFFVIFYGLRRCGKTTMLRTMMHEMKERLEGTKVYLFSTTAECSPEDYTYIPKKAKYFNIGEIESDLGKITGEQKGNYKKFHDGEGEEPEPMLVILDDCVSEETIRHSPSLNALAISGRHYGVSVVILSQVVTGSGSVPPIIRTQCDCIIVVAQPRSERERGLIAEQYLTADNSYNAKRRGLEILAAATDVQYRSLVILTTDSSARKMEEFLLLYGPVDDTKVDKDFRLGTEEQWGDEDENDKKKAKKRNFEKKKQKPKSNEEMFALPNPFDSAPDLPIIGGEYLHGLSEGPKRPRRR